MLWKQLARMPKVQQLALAMVSVLNCLWQLRRCTICLSLISRRNRRKSSVSQVVLVAVIDHYRKGGSNNTRIQMPANPSKKQLRSDALVELPVNGGRIERIRQKGKFLYGTKQAR